MPKLHNLKAPFPYYGGKGKWAETIWAKLGEPDVYSEPFAGSIAVLLQKEQPCRREVICDTNGHIVNFWRAMQSKPEEVARWADYPSFHDDLTARHRYLVQWGRDHIDIIQNDPDWFDSKAAGWWVWGQSNWIGNAFCRDLGKEDVENRVMQYAEKPNGRGVCVNRRQYAQVGDTSKPTMRNQGITANKVHLDNTLPIGKGDRLIEWFKSIQQRLSRVYIINRSWESAVTDTLLCAGQKHFVQGILLDPPYLVENRSKKNLYQSDIDGSTKDAAMDSYKWAIENGNRFRIAYCFQEGDFEVPNDWELFTRPFTGKQIKREDTDKKDAIMFSPSCLEIEEINNGKLI